MAHPKKEMTSLHFRYVFKYRIAFLVNPKNPWTLLGPSERTLRKDSPPSPQGDRFRPFMVDTGLLRKDEVEQTSSRVCGSCRVVVALGLRFVS